MIAVVWAFARTKVGMIAIAVVLALIVTVLVVRARDKRMIEQHDQRGAQEIQKRANDATDSRNSLPLDPDRLQQGDGRCRDCR